MLDHGLGQRCPAGRARRADHLDDRNSVLGRELEVTLVVSGHGHDRACSITPEHVVGDVHRNLGVVYGIDRKAAGEDAGLFLARLSIALALVLGLLDVRDDLFSTRVRGDPCDQRMLRRQHHEGRPEQRVRTGREDFDRRIVACHLEQDLRAL